jgi:hypothetical protein
MPSVKNIIIFITIGLVMVLGYVFFIKGDGEEDNLTTDAGTPTLPDTTTPAADPAIGQDFLGLLLNVKNIKLDGAIFANPAFKSLQDSSIVLIPDGNEGRLNPFAPIGSDIVAPPVVEDTTTDATDTPADTTDDDTTNPN